MHYLTCLPLPIYIRLKFFRKRNAKALFGRQRTSQVRWYLFGSWKLNIYSPRWKQHHSKTRQFWCQQHSQVYEGVLGIFSMTAQLVKCSIYLHPLLFFISWNEVLTLWRLWGVVSKPWLGSGDPNFGFSHACKNQVDFPSKVLVAEDFSPSLSLTLEQVVWEGVWRKKRLWPFHTVFWSLRTSAKICLENFLFPCSISCGVQNGHQGYLKESPFFDQEVQQYQIPSENSNSETKNVDKSLWSGWVLVDWFCVVVNQISSPGETSAWDQHTQPQAHIPMRPEEIDIFITAQSCCQ